MTDTSSKKIVENCKLKQCHNTSMRMVKIENNGVTNCQQRYGIAGTLLVGMQNGILWKTVEQFLIKLNIAM